MSETRLEYCWVGENGGFEFRVISNSQCGGGLEMERDAHECLTLFGVSFIRWRACVMVG